MKQGVEEYIKKETKLESFDVDVEEIKHVDDEEIKEKIVLFPVEEFDDVLFDM